MKERILTFIESQGLTIRDFERKCGMSNGYIKSMRKGLGADKLNNVLSSFPEINREWLVFGEGPMVKEADKSKATPLLESKESNSYLTYLLPISSRGGTLTGISAEGTILESCEKIISPIAGVDFAISVYGESMAPEYPSGSIILIKKIDPGLFIDWGRVYVIDTPNGVILKKVYQCKEKKGYITCHSLNTDPGYTDFDIPLKEVYGMYRVLMCLSVK